MFLYNPSSIYISMKNLISMLVIAAIATTVVTVGVQSAFAATNAFGDAVSSQAKNQDQGSFGQHQAEFAQAYGGLGQFNCATCGQK